MKWLGDKIHSLGLLFGMYSDAGATQCCSRIYGNKVWHCSEHIMRLVWMFLLELCVHNYISTNVPDVTCVPMPLILTALPTAAPGQRRVGWTWSNRRAHVRLVGCGLPEARRVWPSTDIISKHAWVFAPGRSEVSWSCSSCLPQCVMASTLSDSSLVCLSLTQHMCMLHRSLLLPRAVNVVSHWNISVVVLQVMPWITPDAGSTIPSTDPQECQASPTAGAPLVLRLTSVRVVHLLSLWVRFNEGF